MTSHLATLPNLLLQLGLLISFELNMTPLDFACCVSNLRIHEEKLSLSFDTSFGFRWFYGFANFAPR